MTRNMFEEKPKTIPVKVALRCRPLIKKEVDEGCQSCLQVISGEPQVVLGKDRAFTYDFAFGAYDPQADVYNSACRHLVKNVFKGYNATVLAYGQTGSGKTFTMGGYEASLEGDEDAMGVIPRILREVFQTRKIAGSESSVRVSYMEIYKEELVDLLGLSNDKPSLSIREEGSGGIVIQGLREIPVTSFDETMKLLAQGAHGRTTGATAMNTTSSRSHAIFTLHIDQKTDEGDLSKVKFHMVDLAGSERCKRTMAEGERLKEGININRGLLALGNVISALGEEGSQKRQHIPYRDSKLTRILQDSLGGNSHTLMIACVSPADSNIEETLNTLRYADRARKIKNKPIINRDPQAAEIMRLKTLVQNLQSQLYATIPPSVKGSDVQNATVTTVTNTSCCTNTSAFFPPYFNNDNDEAKSERIKELEEETYKLSVQLEKSVGQSTATLNQMLQLEDSYERFKVNVNQVKDDMSNHLELLSSSLDLESNPQTKTELDKLQKLIGSLGTGFLPQDEDDNGDALEDEEDNKEKENNQNEEGSEETSNDMTMSTPASRVATQQHAIRQAALQQQLSEINNILSAKQAMAEKYEAAEEQMKAMKTMYEEMLNEFKTKTDQLEKEKEQLASNLIGAKTNANASRVAEQRRQRLKDLEQQMAQLKKKMAEQSKIVKMKESSDKQMGKLGSEIVLLKQQRVKLMKQMKEEVSSFQKWKKEKEKQVAQLQLKDRKRDVELTKMKRQFEQQQAVQKRRTAEAMAANKRLLDALAKNKEVEEERSNKLKKYNSTAIGNRVRQWLSHELEVKVSTVEAQFHLDQLMEQRAQLTQYLKELNDEWEAGPLSERFSWLGENGPDEVIKEEEDAIKGHLKSTELDIELINAQIQELQQKLVDADQESKGISTWQSLHTMTEAKCALKFLLEQAINARSENLKVQGKLRSVQDKDFLERDDVKELKATLSQQKASYERRIAKLKRECDDRVISLLGNAGSNCNSPSKQGQKEFNKAVKSRLQHAEELEQRLKETKQECDQLKLRLLLHTKDSEDKEFRYLPDIDCGGEIKIEDIKSEINVMNTTVTLDTGSDLESQLPSPDSSQENVEVKRKCSFKCEEASLSEDTADTSENSDRTVSPGSLKRRSGEEPEPTGPGKTKKKRRLLLEKNVSYFTQVEKDK